MTIREYRKGESGGVAELWRRNPSKEFPLLGLNPDVVGDILRKTERPGIQFVIRLARLFRRPIFAMFVVDLDGQVMGTTLLNFTREAGYVFGVVVDSTVRRQGHAQGMLRACDVICQRYRRRFVVLDVLSANDPALRLYDRWGYQRLREQHWMSRAFVPGSAPLPPLSGTTRVRPFRRSDGTALAEADNALMPTEVRAVAPRHPSEFRVPAIAQGILESDTEAWVAEVDGRPVGFLRATRSHLMDAANLSSPLFRRDVAGSVMQDLLVTALRWIVEQNAPRVVTEVLDHQVRARPILDSLGFVEQFRVHTLVHRLAA
ncbi:MAG: GNAT family N-acetyltransferase [Thermoplasmata archaeon]|nr:GNAT family N-acetyltransferase [Thermoplasmata archaeon]